MRDDEIPRWEQWARFRFSVIGGLLSSPPRAGTSRRRCASSPGAPASTRFARQSGWYSGSRRSSGGTTKPREPPIRSPPWGESPGPSPAGSGRSLLSSFRCSKPGITHTRAGPCTSTKTTSPPWSPSALSFSGVVILRVDASLYFANLKFFEERVERATAARPDTRWVLVDLSGVNGVNAVAVHTLGEIVERARSQGDPFAFPSMKGPVRDVFARAR